MILVVGATGTNGREVVNRLAAAGEHIRAMVRNPAKAGDLRIANVEVVAGDLDDPASLVAALAGVDRVFFASAVDQRFVAWFRNFLVAARQTSKPHVVKLSAFGADTGSSSEILRQHGETDKLLADSALRFTILRPNAFYQNMLWSAGTIKDHGAFYVPMRDAKQSLVDVRDIAAVAVEALTGPGHEGHVYELTGPESLSYHDVAAKLSVVLGRSIQYVDVPLEAAKQSMLKAGMPEWNAGAVAELYGLFAAGQGARTTDSVATITKKAPISFEQFAQEHAAAFQ
jgi:uncharacterized protein YbjT (DUF2867 family)